MKGKFLSIFFLLNILELINSAIEIQDKITLKDYNMGNMNYSMEKDLGQCACDLSKFCDYKCDCATYDDGKKCVESYEYKDRMDEYLCKSRKRAFEYNKDKAGINLKDHIHSLMCVQFDKTVDLGEFYKKDPEEPDTLAREWVSQFFPNKEIKKGENEIYKPDSNGYCVKTSIDEIKNNEYSCIYNKNSIDFVEEGESYGSGTNYNEVKVNVATNKSTILKSIEKLNIVNFKILWDTKKTKNILPIGYSQGNPISIKIGNDIYKEYYFPIIDNQGDCIKYKNNEDYTINFKTILFKNDAIYACKTSDIATSYIYEYLCNKDIYICSNPNCYDSKKIVCPTLSKNTGVNFKLNIYTSKKGKQLSQYEEIIGNNLFIDETGEEGLLIFKINFVDVSYSSKMNTKNEKITSLIPLSDNILKALEEIDK